MGELHTIVETLLFNKIMHFEDNITHISSKRAYENKSWNRGSIFLIVKYDLLIWVQNRDPKVTDSPCQYSNINFVHYRHKITYNTERKYTE